MQTSDMKPHPADCSHESAEQDVNQAGMPLSRRSLLALGAMGVGGASLAPAGAAGPGPMRVAESLKAYHSFGDKPSGGPGDNACGEWMERELKSAGYEVSRQFVNVPAFEGPGATLECDGRSAEVIPQAVVVPTSPQGVRAALYMAGEEHSSGGMAVIVLPYARRSSIVGEPERQVHLEISRGASAVILITEGPTGDACALNAGANRSFSKPVAVLAPRDAAPFLEAARRGGEALLRMPGRSFRRNAFNVVASLDRRKAKTLVISTPRSGWFNCMAERGAGVAAWMELARWAARTPLSVNVALVATTAHEYEQIGGEEYIRHLAPRPAKTALWLHLGANLAAPDWHERQGKLLRLNSADSQRFLVASPAMLADARRAFRGLAGLENVYPASADFAGGETLYILKAGYDPVIGAFGNNRYHHTKTDDLRCYAPELAFPVVRAFQSVLARSFAA